MMKRILALFVALILISLITASYAAKEQENDFVFSVKGKSATIIKYIGNETGILEVPDTLGGKRVRVIGKEAFQEASPSRIILPEGLDTIEEKAFYNARAYDIILPDSGNILTINSRAFDRCSNLQKFYIPATVEFVGNNFFSNCSELSDFELNPEHKKYEMLEKVLITKKEKRLIAFPEKMTIPTFRIPDGVREIPDACCSLLMDCKELIIPDSVETIGICAFMTLHSVRELEIGSGIKKMGASAFSNCHNLKTVIIHDGAKMIGDKAFKECSKLEAIYVPVSVKKIGNDAFPDNYNLKIVTDFKSTAAKYARNHGIDLVAPDPDDYLPVIISDD